ncbi:MULTISPECIES: sugar ABC transporter substrate-binding protein [unclassified Rhizobium]|uniref:sugar ABC transporter substrate-binding protein n=1 Tax=unclassified Rhizobium TaxID=2613769 RepID=UPI001ADD2457|nr:MULTISPECIES: sugar ABC transporter substrate-binding protein [unclassified Rhizobium]MBO9123768.1 ABC transporter substrate-binding protein [Rhizobium sp. 16-488-2b]MBO9174300.1 ABC transporter substrate-binding protein [Rhizobium sp. 16-488-2a]
MKLSKVLMRSAVCLSLLPSVVFAQTYKPECFRPASSAVKTIKQDARQGPYRIAVVNGFAGNDWRINMIQAAKAWSTLPDVKPDLKEFKVISTGNDVSAQIAAVDSLIAAGFDGIALNAVNPTSFGPVLKRAKQAGTTIVPFDNVLDVDTVVQVNESQVELGEIKAKDVAARVTKANPKFLEVRGLPGNSVDRDNHDGMRSVLDKVPGATVVEVVGNWDTGTVQKVVADAIATSGPFDGIVCQHGCAGAVRAMIAAKHPVVPLGGDAENGTRIEMAKNNVPGISAAQAPAMSTVALSALIASLKGEALPSLIGLEIPTAKSEELKDGETYFTKLPATFYAATSFPGCGLNFTSDDILNQTPDNF